MKINQWHLVISRNMSFWHQCSSSRGHCYSSADFGIGARLRTLFVVANGTETHLFLHSKNIDEYKKAVIEAVNTKQKIRKLEEKYQKYSKKPFKALKSCEKNLTASNWEKFIKEYQRFCAGLFITAILGRVGVELLTAKLKKKGFPEREIPEILAAITYPKEHTPLFDSQFDLLSIGEKIQNKTIKKDKVDYYLKKWLKKYGHIPVNFCGEPWRLTNAKKQLDEILQKNCKKEKNILKKNHKEKTTKAEALLGKINDKKIEILAQAVQKGTILNEFRKNVFSNISLKTRPIFARIARVYNLPSWKSCFYLRPEEITLLLKDKQVPVREIIKKRKLVGMKIGPDCNLSFLKDSELKSFFAYIKLTHGKSGKKDSKTKQIKGLSANRGKVRGVVKIILSSKDFNKIKSKEILVTAMTSVDFVPIMEKAAAFITNEGGITSHAAIVAREMDKPCIIGTKIATKILKDGDLVEVDAEKGIVKILKKK